MNRALRAFGALCLVVSATFCTSSSKVERSVEPTIRRGQGQFKAIDPPSMRVASPLDCTYNEDAGTIVVGRVRDAAGRVHGWVHRGEEDRYFDLPDASFVVAAGVNSAEDIVGMYRVGGQTEHAFFWRRGAMTNIDVPGATGSFAHGINGAGDIVGEFTDRDGGTHGFLLQANRYTQFDAPNSNYTCLWKINSKNQISGMYRDMAGVFHAFRLELGDGGFFRIDVPGAFETAGEPFRNRSGGLGPSGEVLNYFRDDAGTHGFVARPDGTFITFDFPGAAETAAWGLNERGDIVGPYAREEDEEVHAFLLTGLH